MAVEPKRGCGYRKVGGLYLVSGSGGMPCCKLPVPLTVCPTCNGGIKQSRGWTWINPQPFLKGVCLIDDPRCVAENPAALGEHVGLLWIGERFYPTPAHFQNEAAKLGISRRIAAIPRGFEVGKHWIFFAHPKAIAVPDEEADKSLEAGMFHVKFGPGIFRIFLPERIEKIVTQSQSEDEAEMAKLRERGITPVIVPDDDRDHQGSVYDDEIEELENA